VLLLTVTTKQQIYVAAQYSIKQTLYKSVLTVLTCSEQYKNIQNAQSAMFG